MFSDSNNTPRWTIYIGALASIATIIGVVIAYFAYVHPLSSPSNTNPTPSPVIANPTIPIINSPNSVSTQSPLQVTPTVDLPGAKSTIENFCQDVNSGALQWAYNLTSSNYQNQHGFDEFTSKFNNADISHVGCGYNQPAASGNNVVVSLIMNKLDPGNGTTSSTNYTVTLVKDAQSGKWEIDSITP